MTGQANAPLEGVSVLIVEDRYLIATDLAHEVMHLGGKVLGPAPSLAAAAELMDQEPISLALLDVNLDGEAVYPLAEALADRGVPIVFVTGYDPETLPPAWKGYPYVEKPLCISTLVGDA